MKNNLIAFAFGLLSGFLILFISIRSCGHKDKRVTSVVIPTLPSSKELRSASTKSENEVLKKFDSLTALSAKQDVELKGTKSALNKEKQKNFSLQLQVFSLLDRRFEQQQKKNYGVNGPLDDSLTAMVPELIESSMAKDSLYESATTNLEAQVQNRDSAITLQEQQYRVLKKLFGESITQQTTLEGQNKNLIKQVRHQKVKSKILSAVLFVLSGIAATYLVNH